MATRPLMVEGGSMAAATPPVFPSASRSTDSTLPASAAATDAYPPAGPAYIPSAVPHDLLAGCAAAHRRLVNIAGRIDDRIARRPSLLPGWTVGHLVTHLARNADSHAGMVEAAAQGEIRDQYPGGQAQRDRAISAGAGRPAAVLADDLVTAITRLERAWDNTHVDGWRTGLGRTGHHGPVTLADLVFYRWREADLHLVDMGAADLGGTRWEDLNPAYVDAEWHWTTRGLGSRVPAANTLVLAPGDRPSRAFGAGPELVVVDAPSLVTLRWLTGRGGGHPSWPELGPWT
jgi:maleylpyruvate isomerase